MRRIVTALAVLGLLAAPAQAQQAGTFTVGGFADFTLFDNEVGFTELPGLGAGGHLGLFLLPNLAVEASAYYDRGELSTTNEDAGFLPLAAHLVYNFPATESFYPMLGIGYARQKYTGALGDETDDAISALVGFKTYLTEKLALRLDARVNYAWAPYNEGGGIEDHTNATFTFGFSYDLFGGRVGDADGDGVNDNEDACSNTPAGVQVDARGCRIDRDGDGVFIENDECPNTPRGVSVDASGCRVDSDGDSVFDEEDRCRNTPAGVAVDASGCPLDGDNDGVADYEDDCPNTPAGAPVNASGCQLDRDGDGVYDRMDRCPNTPAGTQVDDRGCEILFEDEETPLVLEGVTFATNSAELTGNSATILDRVAQSLAANPEVRVRVVGHTDNTGSTAYNVQLSQRRAESVRDYLVGQGVAAGQLEAVGVGPQSPIASNDTEEGRARNRRVELELISN